MSVSAIAANAAVVVASVAGLSKVAYNRYGLKPKNSLSPANQLPENLENAVSARHC